jgi:hypothetical protein
VREIFISCHSTPSLSEAFPRNPTNHRALDPESYAWDPLDGELSKKLDTQPYVSMSRERAPQDAKPFPDIAPDVDETELSLFDINMPGVLTLEEVKALDLNHWHLLYHGSFVQMEVSFSCFLACMACQVLTRCRILSAGIECPWIARSRSRVSLLSLPRYSDRSS